VKSDARSAFAEASADRRVMSWLAAAPAAERHREFWPLTPALLPLLGGEGEFVAAFLKNMRLDSQESFFSTPLDTGIK
jgi:hypothetical protein